MTVFPIYLRKSKPVHAIQRRRLVRDIRTRNFPKRKNPTRTAVELIQSPPSAAVVVSLLSLAVLILQQPCAHK